MVEIFILAEQTHSRILQTVFFCKRIPNDSKLIHNHLPRRIKSVSIKNIIEVNFYDWVFPSKKYVK